MEQPKRILISCLSGLGNLVLFLPSLTHYRRCYPEATFTLLCARGPVAELGHLLPEFSAVYQISPTRPGEALTIFRRLRASAFDLAITTFPSNRWQHNLALKLVGPQKSAGFCYEWNRHSNLEFLINESQEAKEGLHDVEQNLGLAQLLTGIAPYPLAFPQLQVAPPERPKPYAVLHPSASRTEPYKGTSPERFQVFAQLQRWLAKEHNLDSVFVGGPEEAEFRPLLETLLESQSEFIYGAPLTQVASLLKGAELLINVDSGLGHLATLTGTPSVTIFSGGNPARTRPRGPRQTALSAIGPSDGHYRYPFQRGKSFRTDWRPELLDEVVTAAGNAFR